MKEIANKCCEIRSIIFAPEVLKNSRMKLLLVVYFLWGVVSVDLSRKQGSLIMSIYGGVIIVSQIMVGFLADFLQLPTSYILISSLFGMSASSVAFIFCDSFPLFATFASLFGICHGFSLTIRIPLVTCIVDKENIDKGYSPLCLLIGLAYTIFPIIAGALYDATQSFDATFYFAGACLFVSCISSSGIIQMQRKKEIQRIIY